MKHLTILVPGGQHNLSSVVGSYKMFRRANDYWQSQGKDPMFEVELAGTSPEIIFHEGIFTVRPHKHLKEIHRTDLVIIPALQPKPIVYSSFERTLEENAELVSWTKEQYLQGAEVASLCTGAFILASTGLLEGRQCSTHWFAANAFRKMFPKVKLVTEKIITDEHGIYTNGGALSFWNMLVYLVEKYYDRETAIYCAKVFEIDIERSSQSPFIVFTGQKNHQDELIKKAQQFLEYNTQEKISVEDLASRFAVGRRNFDRRFKKATGNTPVEYLQRVKIEAAKKSLELSRKSIQEVMYEVGYSDVKAFRLIFKKITGLSPLVYRQKYNKEAAVLL